VNLRYPEQMEDFLILGYDVEEELHLGLWERKVLNTTDLRRVNCD
jgi:hypothetical protein